MRRARPLAAPLAAAAVLLAPAPAFACATCDAGIRKQVWAGVFGPDFAANVLFSALPFAVFAGVALAVHGPRGTRP